MPASEPRPVSMPKGNTSSGHDSDIHSINNNDDNNDSSRDNAPQPPGVQFSLDPYGHEYLRAQGVPELLDALVEHVLLTRPPSAAAGAYFFLRGLVHGAGSNGGHVNNAPGGAAWGARDVNSRNEGASVPVEGPVGRQHINIVTGYHRELMKLSPGGGAGPSGFTCCPYLINYRGTGLTQGFYYSSGEPVALYGGLHGLQRPPRGSAYHQFAPRSLGGVAVLGANASSGGWLRLFDLRGAPRHRAQPLPPWTSDADDTDMIIPDEYSVNIGRHIDGIPLALPISTALVAACPASGCVFVATGGLDLFESESTDSSSGPEEWDDEAAQTDEDDDRHGSRFPLPRHRVAGAVPGSASPLPTIIRKYRISDNREVARWRINAARCPHHIITCLIVHHELRHLIVLMRRVAPPPGPGAASTEETSSIGGAVLQCADGGVLRILAGNASPGARYAKGEGPAPEAGPASVEESATSYSDAFEDVSHLIPGWRRAQRRSQRHLMGHQPQVSQEPEQLDHQPKDVMTATDNDKSHYHYPNGLLRREVSLAEAYYRPGCRGTPLKTVSGRSSKAHQPFIIPSAFAIPDDVLAGLILYDNYSSADDNNNNNNNNNNDNNTGSGASSKFSVFSLWLLRPRCIEKRDYETLALEHTVHLPEMLFTASGLGPYDQLSQAVPGDSTSHGLARSKGLGGGPALSRCPATPRPYFVQNPSTTITSFIASRSHIWLAVKMILAPAAHAASSGSYNVYCNAVDIVNPSASALIAKGDKNQAKAAIADTSSKSNTNNSYGQNSNNDNESNNNNNNNNNSNNNNNNNNNNINNNNNNNNNNIGWARYEFNRLRGHRLTPPTTSMYISPDFSHSGTWHLSFGRDGARGGASRAGDGSASAAGGRPGLAAGAFRPKYSPKSKKTSIFRHLHKNRNYHTHFLDSDGEEGSGGSGDEAADSGRGLTAGGDTRDGTLSLINDNGIAVMTIPIVNWCRGCMICDQVTGLLWLYAAASPGGADGPGAGRATDGLDVGGCAHDRLLLFDPFLRQVLVAHDLPESPGGVTLVPL